MFVLVVLFLSLYCLCVCFDPSFLFSSGLCALSLGVVVLLFVLLCCLVVVRVLCDSSVVL